jgi:glycosyltransferase involved in cell wall biosynthesis
MPISIAIPFYNAEEFLADAIRSVFAQTYQEWELILIDDGSTDNSLAIAKAVNDPRIKVISDGKNKKLAGRLNEVTELAKYDYIARMDADDLMSPDRLQIQLDILLANPKIDLVSTGLFSVLNDDTLVGYRGAVEHQVNFEQLINKERGILHASILARKTWYKRNFYNEKLSVGQDSDMWLRASKKNDLNIIIISEPLYIYREEGNITSKKMLKAYTLEREVLSKYIDNKVFKVKYVLKSYSKTGVIFLLDKIGYLGFLQKRRNNIKISQNQIEEYSSILKIIKSTKIPGLD